MKKRNLLKYILGLMTIAFVVMSNTQSVSALENGKEINILFTSDLHSNIISYNERVNGKQINVGGFARLKTLIDEKRANDKDTLVLDCGDVVMGTLSQALIDSEAAELSFLCKAGYDAITYGNHEFDYGAKALSDMYSIAASKYDERPAFVNCNIDWTADDEYTKTLKAGMDQFGENEYVIVEKNGVKIAITGVLGYDAIKCAPTCELTFKDVIESVKDTVDKIKKTENPDMIVCLSHSGTGTELGKTEDEILAKEVPDIDVIISGHSHTELKDYIKVGNTYIVSLGAYGLYTGDVSLSSNSNGRWDMKKYDLIIMDESIEEDPEILAEIDRLNDVCDEKVLGPYNIKAKDIIAVNDGIEFESVQDMYDYHTEMKLGNLLSDALRYEANITPTGQEKPFDMSVVPAGVIRDTILLGDIYADDAFSVFSLGTGPDGNVGYPLVSIYLTGKEIKTVVEIDASISDLMNSARLYASGLSYEYNKKRMILDKVVDVWAEPTFLESSREEIEDDRMYRIVVDSYSMSMLGAVTDMSKGMLSVVPKDENGNPITDIKTCIIYDENGNELKAWAALCKYLSSFSRNSEGISVIPEYYNTLHNRKVVTDSLSPRAMFKNTSKYFYIVVAILLLIIFTIVFIIRSIVKRKHKKKVFK